MNLHHLTREASADLVKIMDHIARNSIDAALDLNNKLRDVMKNLADMPGMGRVVTSLPKGCVAFQLDNISSFIARFPTELKSFVSCMAPAT